MSRTIVVPEWLNESFLQTVLQQDESRDTGVTVKSFNVAPAVASGVNYVCDLFRVQGEYQTRDSPEPVKHVSVIVKTPNASDVIGKCFGDSPLKEYIAYKEFLPQVYKLIKTERFTSMLLYSPDPHILVMEDLKYQGFVMADRLKQLDFEQCVICLKSLAKFHAAGVAIIQRNQRFIQTLGKEILYDRNDETAYQKCQEMTKNSAYMFTKAVRQWKGFENFEEKSYSVWNTLADDLCDIFEPRKDFLNVLNHGDLWTNNMMFKYANDGKVVDFRLLDWQVCRYATPALDLIFLLFTSANQEVRQKRLDELLSVYLETLNSTLEQLDCKEKLTKGQLDAELKRSQCYIFYVTYSILTVALSDPDDLPNLDGLTEDNIVGAERNPYEKCYYGKYYEEVAQQVLRYLNKQGFFDS